MGLQVRGIKGINGCAGPGIRALQAVGSGLRRLGLVLSFACCFLTAPLPGPLSPGATPALAQCINCACNEALHNGTRELIVTQAVETREHIQLQMQYYRDHFWIDFMFKENIAAMLMMMTDQLVNTGMLQIEAVGAMFDAQEQMETQRLMQQLTARAHKDYQTDMEMCTIGSASRALDFAYRNGQLAAHTLAKRAQDRVFLNGEASAGGGAGDDVEGRFDQFRRIYCDSHDEFGQMAGICNHAGASYNTDRDINYMDTVDRPKTIEIDFPGNAAGDEGGHVLAMASNLYGHKTFTSLYNEIYRDPKAHPLYLDVRSIAARRAVSEFSFDSIVGQKASGSASGNGATIARYLDQIYAQLGFNGGFAKLAGEHPSYFSLMEAMNKSVFLRPDFYVDLYTTPANVDRIGATIRASNSMQNMDQLDSQLRMEMNYSQILEAEVGHMQDDVQNQINRLQTAGAPAQPPGGGP